MRIARIGAAVLLGCMVLLAGCAHLSGREPVEVIVAGIEPLEGQGMEARMLVKLRLQNPNDQALSFNGIFVRLDVEGQRFATGVSDQVGSVPRYGETVIGIPMSVSMLDLARQAMDALGGRPRDKLAYELSGRLDGEGFAGLRFHSTGELSLPAGGGAMR
ncbi:MAG: LEA type 2 family protein [Burkholderiaceae bacterium]